MAPPSVADPDPRARDRLLARFDAVRARTEALAAPLSPEDQVVQSMPDASPTKWHLGHTTWFFEAVVLAPAMRGHRAFDPAFAYLFNSYYEALGPRHPRPERGLLTRPPAETVAAYRRHVDAAVRTLAEEADEESWRAAAPLLELGIQHEQQHQELILTDILHAFSRNPLRPAYGQVPPPSGAAAPLRWVAFAGGLHEIGAAATGFAFDNERPRHRVYLEPFRLASRPVTNAEFRAFIADGGYERPELWLSDGWGTVQARGWRHPLYWFRQDGRWRTMSLGGATDLDDAAPVCHLGFYEADAYARWAGRRLPTEAEWEVAAATVPLDGNLGGKGALRPLPADGGGGPRQMFGDVWEWTASAYRPYPGFRPLAGAVGEYNGKFMANQMVLRGGSCATPEGHVRPSYRNFFYPHQRWQFSGLRLAEDA